MRKVASGIAPVITVDRNASKALHRQIYDAYRAAILQGGLRPKQRIPSTRVLASELGVSRFPVLNAYAQLLAEGYIEARVGAGTVVSISIPDQLTSTEPAGTQISVTRSGPRPVARRASMFVSRVRFPTRRGSGAFAVGQVASDQIPINLWSSLVARHCRNMDATSFHYGDPKGSIALREAIAAYLRTARSLRCEADQIIVVSGSQQALELSARVLLDPGCRVWIEEPGYGLAADALAFAGCRLVPVPVDREGLDVAGGIALCRKARAVFVTPSHQFPLGVTMSASRRMRLLEWAQISGAWIIEDDYDSEFRYRGMPVAALQGLDANARVIYIGTFSKVLFPSLRLGYIVVPSDVVDQFVAVRRAMDLGPPAFHQEVLADFMSEGHFARHIRRMRVLYRDRRSALAESISTELGPAVEMLGDEAGMHLSVAVRNGVHDVEIAERAARQNLWIWPLSPSYLGKTPRHGFILGFGSTPATEIPGAVRKLSKLLAKT